MCTRQAKLTLHREPLARAEITRETLWLARGSQGSPADGLWVTTFHFSQKPRMRLCRKPTMMIAVSKNFSYAMARLFVYL